MDAVERLRNKRLYKIELYLIKIIPMIIALIYLSNTILSYFNIDIPLLSYLGGVSVLELLFLYISSIVFRFCIYHRLFIHYIIINWLINIYDYYIGIALNDKNMFLVYMIIAGVFIFILLFTRPKPNGQRTN